MTTPTVTVLESPNPSPGLVRMIRDHVARHTPGPIETIVARLDQPGRVVVSYTPTGGQHVMAGPMYF